MSYPISQNNSPYAQPLTGLNSTPLPNVDTDKVKQGVNNSPVGKAAAHDDPKLLVGLMLPIGVGVAVGMNKFNKACRGEYGDSAIGKIGKFGDKIGRLKIIDNDIIKNMQKKSHSVKTFLHEKIINKNKILSAFFNTPSMPRNHMVLTQSKGTIAEVAGSTTQMFEKFTNGGKDLEKIKQLGFVKDGAADVERYKEIVKKSYDHSDEILEACKKQGLEGSYKSERAGKIPLSKFLFKEDKYLTDLIPSSKKILCKETYFSEFANKIEGLKGTNNTAHATGVGKALPKQTLRIIEGLTNASTGGGVLAVLMGTYIIADATAKAIRAPKGNGEKRKTFAEQIVYNLGWYLTLPFGINLMHKFGGLQYIGVKKEDVEQYRKDVEDLNKKAATGDFGKATLAENEAAHAAEKLRLKNVLKGDTRILKEDSSSTKAVKFAKNLIFRPLKWVGRMFTAGLETPRAFIKQGTSKTGAFFKDIRFYLKNYAFGSPVRFITYMFLIAPFLGKIAAKSSHLVFGKPTKSVLDEGKEPKEESKNLPQPVMAKPLTQVQPQSVIKPVQNSNLASMHNSNNMAHNQMAPAQKENLINMYNPNSSPKKEMMSSKEPARSYVPSSDGVVLEKNSQDVAKDEKVNNLLGKADRAEKVANQFIK